MKKKQVWKTRIFALTAAAAMAAGSLAGCGAPKKEESREKVTDAATQAASGSSAPEAVTLKVLMTGDKPNDWDRVLDEFYSRTEETLNLTFDWQWVSSGDYKDKLNVKMTAGEEYDLVFDAPWMNLRTLAQDNVYADLAPYLNNPDYPGLQKCFPEDIMKYNKYSDINCAFPLFFTYTGVNIVMYRLDWAKEFGIGKEGQIESMEELRQYLEAVKAEKQGVTPIVLKDNRGFYHLFDAITNDMKDQHIYQGSLGQDIFFAIKLNEEETGVMATALPGDTPEYWEPFGGEDFWKRKVETSREWNQYCETDSLNQKDPGSVFQIGKAGAYIDTIDAFPKFRQLLTNYNPGSELGIFVHEDSARNLEKGAYSASVTASNCLCIPAGSKKIDRTIAFLNWIFESPENHDLFEYGIEGTHWEPIGDSQYKLPEGVNAATNYNPNGWNLTWTPNYYRFSSEFTDYALQYAKYATELDNFYISNMTGFVFQSDPVKTEIAQNGAILGEVLTPLNHGILDNPYEVFQETTAKMRKSGVQTALDEYVRQLNEFLQSK